MMRELAVQNRIELRQTLLLLLLIWSKRPSNRIKNGSRIFEHPQDCSSSDTEIGFEKGKVGYTFCSTLLDT